MLPKVNSLPIQRLPFLFSFILILQLLTGNQILLAQCTGTVANPSRPISASAFNDTMVVQTTSRPGQYFRVENLSLNKNYVFMSSAAGDYITIRHVYSNAVLGHGVAPFTYAVGDGPDVVTVHINLQSPICGTSSENRTTRMACINCPPVPPVVGIGTNEPNATLDVGGEIKLGNSTRPPEAGMIRWNPDTKDFEGFNGTAWMSLTKANSNDGQWGQISAVNIQENSKLTEEDGATDNNFGISVGMSGDYAIIGSYKAKVGNNLSQGVAYIFVRNGTSWIEQAQLTADDGMANDLFGFAVSINGDYAMVGAYRNDPGNISNRGAAYIFLRSGTTWIQQAKLTAMDGAAEDEFGNAVSINGNYAIVGARLANVDAKIDQGAAYIFVRSGTNWTQQVKLTALDGAKGDQFGNAVDISGDYAIVGALADTVNAKQYQGSAFIFIRSGISWTQQAKIIASDGAINDFFGVAVSISGDYAMVGTGFDDVGANTDQGSAYIFVRNGTNWTQQVKLIASDASANDKFGNSVSINGDYAIVGSPNYGGLTNNNQGAAYLFVRKGTAWKEQAKLTASDGATNDNFGYAVSISGNFAIVGAVFSDVNTNEDNKGAVYIIQKN